MKNLVVIAHDIRSTYNVGSLLRTADGLGIKAVYLTGYTPYPLAPQDDRLPHISQKVTKRINKTALGAESSQTWQYVKDVTALIAKLKSEGYMICALEQAPGSQSLTSFKPPRNCALLLGREIEGVSEQLLALCDMILELPMAGAKESLNVTVAASIALFYLQYYPFSA